MFQSREMMRQTSLSFICVTDVVFNYRPLQGNTCLMPDRWCTLNERLFKYLFFTSFLNVWGDALFTVQCSNFAPKKNIDFFRFIYRVTDIIMYTGASQTFMGFILTTHFCLDPFKWCCCPPLTAAGSQKQPSPSPCQYRYLHRHMIRKSLTADL